MGKRNKLVSIIIASWNQRELLFQCLNSLNKLRYRPFEIIVVDNGSTDGSVSEVKKRFKKVRVIRNKKNLGYAKANNIGYKEARGDYIFLLNNDTKVTSGLATNLVKTLESNSKIGAVQAKIYVMDHPDKNDLVGTYLTPTGFVYYFGYWKPDEPKYSRRRPVFFAKGAAMMIKREVIEKVGLFDGDYISYFEEYDFCWRVWLAGWKVIYEPSAIVYHKAAVTTRTLPVPYSVNLTYRNRITTLIKNLSLSNLLWMLPTHIFICLGLGVYYLTKDYKLTKAVYSGIYWNFLNLRRILKKRRYVQEELRKTSDKKLLKGNMVNVPLSYYWFLTDKAQLFKDINM